MRQDAERIREELKIKEEKEAMRLEAARLRAELLGEPFIEPNITIDGSNLTINSTENITLSNETE